MAAGGALGVPEALAARLAARYPGMQIVGTLFPPIRALSPAEEESIFARGHGGSACSTASGTAKSP